MAAAQTYPNMAGELGKVDKHLEAERSSETDVSGLGLDCHVNKAKKSVRLANDDKETVCSASGQSTNTARVWCAVCGSAGRVSLDAVIAPSTECRTHFVPLPDMSCWCRRMGSLKGSVLVKQVTRKQRFKC